MIKMSEKSRRFLQKYLPQFVNAERAKDILAPLYDLINYRGFDENYEYNDFGDEAQAVYDDIFYGNTGDG